MLDFQNLYNSHRLMSLELRKSTYEDRKRKLERMLDYLLQHGETIESAVAADLNKPVGEALLAEVLPLTTELRYHLKHLKRWMRPHAVSGSMMTVGISSSIQYEPKGTSLIISPWNYPISLAIKPLIAAVSAGCTAIIKPSEFSPASGKFIRDFVTAVFAPQEVSVVEGDAAVATALLKLPFDHIFFTGSPQVGKIVMEAAAKHLASVTLELGGKSPVIVDSTVNLEQVAEQVVWAKFINAGQTCIAPDFVLVEANVEKEFISYLKMKIRQLYSVSETARIVNERHLKRLNNLISDAKEEGAIIEAGGVSDGLMLTPTILSEVTPHMAVMKEEIFGPILPVLRYQYLPEIIHLLQAHPKPLALYIFSKDSETITRLSQEVSAGNTMINELLLQFTHPEIPFGGINNSGIGKSNGFFGFKEFSNEKGVMQRTFGTMRFIFPPYTPQKIKLLNFIKRYI